MQIGDRVSRVDGITGYISGIEFGSIYPIRIDWDDDTIDWYTEKPFRKKEIAITSSRLDSETVDFYKIEQILINNGISSGAMRSNILNELSKILAMEDE